MGCRDYSIIPVGGLTFFMTDYMVTCFLRTYYPGHDILSRIVISNSFQGIPENRDRHSSPLGISSSIAVKGNENQKDL
jgi:hypothetical protein